MELSDLTINIYREFSRILRFLEKPLGQKLFRLKDYKKLHFELEILPNPGGRLLITSPFDYPEKKPMWVVTIGDRLLTCLNVRSPASTVLQAFMFGTFVITKWLNEEMPLEVTRFDLAYYKSTLEDPDLAVVSYLIHERRFA